MPRQKPSLARVLVPLAVILLGVGVVWAIFVSSGQKPGGQGVPAGPNAPASSGSGPIAGTETTPQAGGGEPVAGDQAAPEQTNEAEEPRQTAAAAQQPDEAPEPVLEAPPEEGASEPEQAVGADEQAASASPYRARRFAGREPLTPLGGLDAGGGYALRLEFGDYGAGLASARLASFYNTVEELTAATHGGVTEPDDAHVEVQAQRLETRDSGEIWVLAPFMMLGVEIDGAFIDMRGKEAIDARVWRETAPGAFEAVVEDEGGGAVLRLTRRYVLNGTYDFEIEQRVENLADHPLELRFYELGPMDLERDLTGYGGDKRRVRFGYLLPPLASQPNRREFVQADDYLWSRRTALGRKQGGVYTPEKELWPNDHSQREKHDLVWAAMTNRYFGVAVHPLIDPADPTQDKQFHDAERIDRVLFDQADGEGMALRITGPEFTLDPGDTHEMDRGVYAGPLSRKAMGARSRAAGVDGLIVYNFGGPCAFCTFPVITGLLFWLLSSLHGYVVFDWALAIIVLVVIVRTFLHPVTRWSQIRMARFGKQMQRMGPKMQKVKEKYADDPKRQQAEVRKLWSEEGINPAGFLGCLPMFLQTPVWIALYATLFFAIELRHQPAFFGLFQHLGGWAFLGDLASPDKAFSFGHAIKVPVLSTLMGPISSINILPLFLGIVFFLHQKYLTPQTAVAATPEQEQQQKIIRVMTVVMFPFIMYNAPSGLALYFITNSTLAIFETRWIRAAAEAKGLLDPDKKAPKTGFLGKRLERLKELAAQQQQLRQMQQAGNQPGTGKRKQVRPGRDHPSRKQYKKRK